MNKTILLTLMLVTFLTAASDTGKKDFLKKFHFKGDLRLRYESKEATYFDKTEKNTYHNRYRLRLSSHVDIIDNLQFEVAMRSGYANPTSGNQTFKDDEALFGYFWNSLRFNALAIDYKFDNSMFKVGRAAYMIYRPIKSQLIWDNDIGLNGINYQYKDDENILTVGLNQTSYAEASKSKNDVNLFLAQYVRTITLSNAKLNLGTGLYYYDGIKGNTSLYTSNKGSSMGNTMVDGLFTNDYHIVEGFGELKFKNVLCKPFAVAAGVAYNTAASHKNFGYDLAFKLGSAKKVGDWQVKYSYTDLQADSVVGAHSDSDNFGGGTDARGHAIRTKYKFGKKMYLAGTWFFNVRNASKDAKVANTDYQRMQLDAIIKF